VAKKWDGGEKLLFWNRHRFKKKTQADARNKEDFRKEKVVGLVGARHVVPRAKEQTGGTVPDQFF